MIHSGIHLRVTVAVFALWLISAELSWGGQISRVGYTIQVGAFQELAKAERFTGKLREQKLDAICFKKENGLFAVAFGNFSTWHNAAQYAGQLKKQELIEDYFITKPSPTSSGFENHTSAVNRSKIHDVELGRIAARTAERFVGIPYKWGGNNVVEGMDCSAFVKAVYYLVGLEIPRTSQEQFNAGDAVVQNDVKEGDLVFFGKGPNQISHVGMYVGNGKFVHAPRRGEPIQLTSVDNEKYARKYVGSRRYL